MGQEGAGQRIGLPLREGICSVGLERAKLRRSRRGPLLDTVGNLVCEQAPLLRRGQGPSPLPQVNVLALGERVGAEGLDSTARTGAGEDVDVGERALEELLQRTPEPGF